MPTLLLQSCSASKNEVTEPTSALDVYSGYFYKIIKKATRDSALRADLDIRILSAKYGLLEPTETIEYYDQRMDTARAEELRDTILSDLSVLIESEGYDRVVVNMGKQYRHAIDGLDELVPADFHVLEGDGIGTKGHLLKRFIRGEDAALEGTA